jgi:CRISPR-associated protein Csb1
MPDELTFENLKQAVAGKAAAFRCITEYQPAGGPGDKVFPPTYERGQYAGETRIINGEPVSCVLLDSVQSQANRMELALLEAVRDGRIDLPIIEARFEDDRLLKKFTVTSLEAPHRVADAIFRDSLLEENGNRVMFRKSGKGKILDTADVRNATGLFGLCPTALVFGVWDSTGPRGGLGTKIQRAIVSEIVGLHAQMGVKTSSRIDPLQVQLDAGPIYKRSERNDQNPDWAIGIQAAGAKPVKVGKKKDGKPSEVNHSNIPPQIAPGGITIGNAMQTTVLSLVAIRRLRFPLNGRNGSDPQVDVRARAVIAALGLLAAVMAREEGADLRSRCQLVPSQEFEWELIAAPGAGPRKYKVDAETAVVLFKKAVSQAREIGLPWEERISLSPHPDLIELVGRSQEQAAHSEAEEGE